MDSDEVGNLVGSLIGFVTEKHFHLMYATVKSSNEVDVKKLKIKRESKSETIEIFDEPKEGNTIVIRRIEDSVLNTPLYDIRIRDISYL